MAINAKTLKVTFNQAVDKASVLGGTVTAPTLVAGVITLTRTSTDSDANAIDTNNLDAQAATLSEDGKTLIVTAASTKYLKGSYDVKIANVKAATTAAAMENSYLKFTATDAVAPTVTGLTYNVATDKFEVTFSEPIDAKTGEVVRVNGQPVSAGFDTLTAPTTKLTFSRPATVELGTTPTIYVAGLKDAVGNVMTAYTGTVALQKDTTALEVAEVKQLTNTTVQIKFNKKLNSTSDVAIKGKAGLVVTKSDGNTTTNYTVADATTPDGMTFIFTFTDATYATSNTEKFTVTFTDKAFTGVSGTANAVTTKQIELTKDTVAPTIVSAAVNNAKTAIEVTLSEDVTVTPANVKLRLDGVEVTDVTAVLKAGTKNVVEVASTNALTGGKLKTGTYQVRFAAGAVTDMNTNNNIAGNAPSVTVTGTTNEALSVVIAGNGNSFTVTASGSEIFTAASLNYQNYTLDGVVIPADSDIVLNAAKSEITITLPAANTHNFSGSAVLEAKNLTFVSGKPYKVSTGTVSVVDNTSATLTGAKILSNVLELTFDEAVKVTTLTDIDEVLADFTISSAAATFEKSDATATVAAGSTANKIIITVTAGASNWATVMAGNELTITTKAEAGKNVVTNLTDANDVKVKSGVKVNITK